MSGAGSYLPPDLITAATLTEAATKGQTYEYELSEIMQMGAKEKVSVESPEAARQRHEKMKRKEHRDTIVGSLVASFTLLACLAAMFIETSAICYLAFFIPFFTAPYSVRQRKQLNRMPTLRKELNRIRLQVNELSVQNNKLDLMLTRCRSEVTRLGGAEESLQLIAQKNGMTVKELSNLVDENGRILRQMQELVEAKVVTQIMDAITRSDRSQDFYIEDSEMTVLIMRLKEIPGLHVSEEKLREKFQESPSRSVATIVDATKELLREQRLLEMEKKAAAANAEQKTQPKIV